MKKNFYWLPRVLAILFIAFISLFALDVFQEKQWYLALLMHLIPSFILTILTVVAWKNELVGGILFLLAGFIAILFFHSLIISAPVFFIGTLFLTKRFFV